MAIIEQKVKSVQGRINAAAERCGRNPADLLLVAVTKTQSAEIVNEALQSGIRHFGENKVQEAVSKLPLITQPYAGFHFIGHLQSNKVRALLKLEPWLIHSVDSLHLAQSISGELAGTDRIQDILLQVNTSGEQSKSGCEPDELIALAGGISLLPNLSVKGLMTIGRLSDKAEDSRPDFKLLKELAIELKALNVPGIDMQWLSMGMTGDFEIAIEEGANLVRIGSAIFGERHYEQ
jgi:pyridoxal phosphate enzyme (YggS family)